MRSQHFLLLAALALAVPSSACSVIVDGTLQDRDSGIGIDVNLPDAAQDDVFIPTQFCEREEAEDGDFCTLEGSANLRVCSDGLCVRSQCGDGFLDARPGTMEGSEACDDGNDTPNDGCEPDCTITCTAATQTADCDDMNPCTDDVCTANRCEYNANTNTCMVEGMTNTCRGGSCPSPDCGNGELDVGETCDDNNEVGGDGCEADCTPTCTSDEMCDDGAACNGAFACGAATANGARTCMMTAAPVACVDDGNACTTETCEDGVGCVSDGSMNDRDMDGFYATSCGGNDCDDMNAMRNPGLAEVCGNRVDDDCSSATPDDTQTTYYVDCDGDRYASSTTGSMRVCTAPASPPSGCTETSRAWTTRAPTAPNVDCNPRNADVSPGQTRYFTARISSAPLATDYDYNCDGMETPQYPGPGTYFCTDYRGTCLGTTHYTTTPVCGVSATLSRCTRQLLGGCGFTRGSAAPVACR